MALSCRTMSMQTSMYAPKGRTAHRPHNPLLHNCRHRPTQTPTRRSALAYSKVDYKASPYRKRIYLPCVRLLRRRASLCKGWAVLRMKTFMVTESCGPSINCGSASWIVCALGKTRCIYPSQTPHFAGRYWRLLTPMPGPQFFTAVH